jgi:4-hydroxybenzoate polyprenyltransferase
METGSLKNTFKMMGPIALLALAAGLQMLGALLFFKAQVDLILIFTYVFITFSIYLLNKFTDDEDNYNCPEQKILFQRKPILITIPIFLIALSIILLSFTNRLMVWHIVLIICGIFYSVNLIPIIKNNSIAFIRLKDIFFIKNILVSFLWSITPFILAKGLNLLISPKNDFIVVIIASFITAFINTTSSDIRDMVGDRLMGIVTFANFFGKKYTALLLFLISTIGCLYVGINYSAGNISTPATFFFFTIVLLAGIVAAPIYIGKFKLPKLISEPLNDSQAIFNGIALIVLSSYLK